MNPSFNFTLIAINPTMLEATMKIFVKAHPRAKNNLVEKIGENHFEVSVTAPPIKGLANKAIIELLSEYFDVAKSQIELVSGFSSKIKVFEITN